MVLKEPSINQRDDLISSLTTINTLTINVMESYNSQITCW